MCVCVYDIYDMRGQGGNPIATCCPPHGGTVVTSNLTSFVLPPILGLGTREPSSNRLAYFLVAFVLFPVTFVFSLKVPVMTYGTRKCN